MITAQNALSFQPQKAGMNGYRANEVDEFAREVAQTLDFYEKKMRDLQNKINELKQNENIIQTTLVNAQKLAMQITEDSKATADKLLADASAKAAEETAQAEKKAAEIVDEATAKARQLDSETNSIIARLEKEATEKAEKLVLAAKAEAERIDAEAAAKFDRESKLLESLRAEVSKFRADVLNMYKEQVTLIRDLPDMMPEAVLEAAPVQENVDTAASEEQADIEAASDNADVTEAPAEPAAEQSADVADDVAEQAFDGADEQAPSGDLLKIISDLDDNERLADAALDEVASLSDTVIEGQISLSDLKKDDEDDSIPVMPVIKRKGGFTVTFDADDE